MKLISCYIAAFGGIEDREYRFLDGITEILEANGAGKSTLAGFLKAMLYGLDGASKKTLAENDVQFYSPFAGGRFGGSLTFDEGGREYRIERFFERQGKQGVTESLRVIDTLSGEDVRVDNESIGDRLFGVDADSFLRTVYLSPRFTPKEGSAPVGITAKLNDLAGEVFDLGRFDGARQALEKRRTELRLRRGQGGTLYEAEERQRALLDEIREAEAAAIGAAEAKERAARARAEGEELDAVRAEAETALREATARAEAQSARESRRAELSAALLREERALASVKAHFPNGVPTDEELSSLSAMIGRQGALATERQKVERLGAIAPDAEAAERLLALDEKRSEMKSFVYSFKEEDEKTARPVAKFSPPSLVLLLVALAGIGLCFASLTVGLILLLLGGGGAALSLWHAATVRRVAAEQRAVAEQKRTEAETALEELETEIAALCHRLGITESERTLRETLAEKRAEGRLLSERLALLERQRAETDRAIREVLSLYADIPPESEAAVARLRTLTVEMHTLEFSVKEKSEALAALPPREEEGVDDSLLSELRKNSEALRARATEAHAREADQAARAEELCRRAAGLMAARDALAVTKDEIADISRRTSLLDATIEQLDAAKRALEERHLSGVREAFAHYLGYLFEDKDFTFTVDRNLDVSFTERGEGHSALYLSSGLSAMVALCLRLALTDRLYPDERPPLILDDPFVMLDEDNLVLAKDLLSRLAADRQIVYMTCHPSRSLL